MRKRRSFRMWFRDFWREAKETLEFGADPIGGYIKIVLDHHERSKKPRMYLIVDNHRREP